MRNASHPHDILDDGIVTSETLDSFSRLTHHVAQPQRLRHRQNSVFGTFVISLFSGHKEGAPQGLKEMLERWSNENPSHKALFRLDISLRPPAQRRVCLSSNILEHSVCDVQAFNPCFNIHFVASKSILASGLMALLRASANIVVCAQVPSGLCQKSLLRLES